MDLLRAVQSKGGRAAPIQVNAGRETHTTREGSKRAAHGACAMSALTLEYLEAVADEKPESRRNDYNSAAARQCPMAVVLTEGRAVAGQEALVCRDAAHNPGDATCRTTEVHH